MHGVGISIEDLCSRCLHVLWQAALDRQGRAVEVMQQAASPCASAGKRAVEGLHSLASTSEQAAASLSSWGQEKGNEAATAAAHAAKAARKAIQVHSI
jgi:hypothetical protein